MNQYKLKEKWVAGNEKMVFSEAYAELIRTEQFENAGT